MARVGLDSLIPGTEYWVDQYWDIFNTVRNDVPKQFVGKFVRLEYITGKYHTSSSSGLIMICDGGRTNVIFHDANGHERIVSSLNRFYQRYQPSLIDIRNKNNILRLRGHFPPELRRIISSFCGGSKTNKYIRRNAPKNAKMK